MNKLNLLVVFFLFLISMNSAFADNIVDVTPNNPNTNNNLICTLVGNYVPDSYIWEVNGNQVSDLRTNTVPASRTAKNEMWTCKALVNFGYGIISSVGQDSVTIANSIPVLSAIPSATITAGAVFAYQTRASDADNDILRYSISSSPASSIAISQAGLISWTPSTAGTYSVTVTVTDTSGAVAARTFTLTVITAYPALGVDIDADPASGNAPLLVDFEAEANGGTGLNYTFRWDFNGDGAVDEITSGEDNEFTYTTPGTYNATVSVTDSAGNTASASVVITVLAANSPPVLNAIGNKNINEWQLLTFAIRASDADNNTLTYSASGLPAGATFTGRRFSWTPGFTQSGNYSVTFSVTDSIAVDSETINIQVFNVNRIPAITSGPPTTAVVGNLYSYDVDANDPDNDTITYSLTARPAGMTINSATGVISWTPTAPRVGANAVTVSVTDGINAPVTQSFTITVSAAANLPPTITSTALTAAIEGVAYTYDVDATDPESNVLVYSLVTAPTGMTINLANGLISWTPSSSQLGSNNVVVSVTDGINAPVTQSFAINVLSAGSNLPPVITSMPITTATAGAAYSYDVNANDADGDALAYSLRTSPTGMTINSANGLISWTPSSAGTSNVVVSVTDGINPAVTQSFTITVLPAGSNLPPVITSTAVTSAIAGTAYSYDVNANDADGDTLTYSLTTSPSGMTINSASGLISWTPASSQLGSSNVVVSVTDGINAPVTQPFTITVSSSAGGPTDNGQADEDDLFIESIIFKELNLYQKDIIEALVTIENKGDYDFNDLELSMSIPELDIESAVTFDLNDGVKKTYEIQLQLPDYVQEGQYVVKFKVENDDASLVEYRDIFVNEEQRSVSGSAAGSQSSSGEIQIVSQPSISSYVPTQGRESKLNWTGIWFLVILLLALIIVAAYLVKRMAEDNVDKEVSVTSLDNYSGGN